VQNRSPTTGAKLLHQWQFSLMRGGKKHGLLFWLGAWSATAIVTVALILGITFLLERRPAEFAAAGSLPSLPAERPASLELIPTGRPLQQLEPAAGKFPVSNPQNGVGTRWGPRPSPLFPGCPMRNGWQFERTPSSTFQQARLLLNLPR
jgi:hypothetical protein